MKMAILGAGHIAGTMASTISAMREVEAYAIAARDLDRAKAFAEKYQIRKAFGSYEEMLQDPEIDLVYIATPHSHHYEQVKLCLEHGKNVLCEKAFTVNARQAKEILETAKAKGLLLTEAIWPRYMPSRKLLTGLLEEGAIGTPHSLTANFCAPLSQQPRNKYPELAGGALLDLGVYTLNFACMMFPGEISSVVSTACLSDLGVDDQHSILLTFADGRTATLHASQLGISPHDARIYGSEGYLQVDNLFNPKEIQIFDRDFKLSRTVLAPPQISGYEYEVEACRNAIQHGWLECPDMPHAETLRMMRLMDTIREQWGMEYPMDEMP